MAASGNLLRQHILLFHGRIHANHSNPGIRSLCDIRPVVLGFFCRVPLQPELEQVARHGKTAPSSVAATPDTFGGIDNLLVDRRDVVSFMQPDVRIPGMKWRAWNCS